MEMTIKMAPPKGIFGHRKLPPAPQRTRPVVNLSRQSRYVCNIIMPSPTNSKPTPPAKHGMKSHPCLQRRPQRSSDSLKLRGVNPGSRDAKLRSSVSIHKSPLPNTTSSFAPKLHVTSHTTPKHNTNYTSPNSHSIPPNA